MGRIYYLFPNGIPEGTFEELVEYCLDIGCVTTESGKTDRCEYSSQNIIGSRTNTPVTEAIADIEAAEYGSIKLWWDDLDLAVEKNLRSNAVPDIPHFSIRIWDSLLRVFDETQKPHVRMRVDELVNFACALAHHLQPAIGYGAFDETDKYIGPIKSEIIEGRITNLFWLNLYSPTLVEQIGRKKLRSAPAWKVDELDTGWVLLVVTEFPFDFGQFNEQTQSVANHLCLKII